MEQRELDKMQKEELVRLFHELWEHRTDICPHCHTPNLIRTTTAMVVENGEVKERNEIWRCNRCGETCKIGDDIDDGYACS